MIFRVVLYTRFILLIIRWLELRSGCNTASISPEMPSSCQKAGKFDAFQAMGPETTELFPEPPPTSVSLGRVETVITLISVEFHFPYKLRPQTLKIWVPFDR